MTDPQKDTQRSRAAAIVILDGRDPIADRGAVMVTLEQLVSTMLLLTMDRDHRKAVAMLNEGLTPGVEARIAHGASKAKAS